MSATPCDPTRRAGRYRLHGQRRALKPDLMRAIETMTPEPNGDRRSSGPRPRQTTVEKLVTLLEAVADSEDGIGVREVGRLNGIDKSSVSRLFEQLAQLRMVEQHELTGRFVAAPRLFTMAAKIHSRDTLWVAAEPILRGLVNDFNETCYLAIRDGDQVTFREKIDCDQTIRYFIELGQSSPLHAGAGGRAILSGMAVDEFEDFLARRELAPVTASTITDPDELGRQVREDRDRGYTISMGERVMGGSAVAAPYFGMSGDCRGSIVFTCPAERFNIRRAPEIADTVRRASAQLSRRLGHSAANTGERSAEV